MELTEINQQFLQLNDLGLIFKRLHNTYQNVAGNEVKP